MPDRREPDVSEPNDHIVLGYVPGQRDTVLEQAAAFALRLNAELICAVVDEGRYVVEELPDGTVRSMPIDPDGVDEDEDVRDRRVQSHINEVLAGRDVRWRVQFLAGEPAAALAHLADTVDAVMIVVGTRSVHARRSMRDFFGGSNAVRLAHRQHRPVLVIPLNPVAHDADLPWIKSR